MSAKRVPYVRSQGEHLAKLSRVLGFDVDEVWKDPKNSALCVGSARESADRPSIATRRRAAPRLTR